MFDVCVFGIDFTSYLIGDISKSGVVKLTVLNNVKDGYSLQAQEKEYVEMTPNENENISHLLGWLLNLNMRLAGG